MDEAVAEELLASQQRIERTLQALAEDIRRRGPYRVDSEGDGSATRASRASARSSCKRFRVPGLRQSQAPQRLLPPSEDRSMEMCRLSSLSVPQVGTDADSMMNSSGPLLEEDTRHPAGGLHRSSTGLLRAYTLPLAWPSSLKLRDIDSHGIPLNTDEPLVQYANIGGTFGVEPMFSHHSSINSALNSVGKIKTLDFSFLTIDPNSSFGILADVVCLLVLAFDMTSLPLILAWHIDIEGPLLVCMWCTLLWWTLDIFRSFVTGVYKDGILQSDIKQTAERYLSTWFLMDLAVVCIEWVGIMVDNVSSGFKMLRLAKVGRMVRIVGVVRLLRFARVMEDVIERSFSHIHHLLLRVMMIMCTALWITHVLSCCWYAIGQSAANSWLNDTGIAWVDRPAVAGFEGELLSQTSMMYQYMSAFHFTIAQLTLGSSEIAPSNSLERAFTIVCLLVGLVVGSALISSLSAMMVQLQARRKEEMQKLRMLHRYMRENNVSMTLAARVMRQAKERLTRKAQLTDEDVPGMQLLSQTLRSELHYAIFEPCIRRHPLLRLWSRIDQNVLQDVCEQSVDNVFLRQQDDLFVPGYKAEHVYYVINGTIDYIQDPDTSAVRHRSTVSVGEGRWISESALWCEWIHVGHAIASSPCKLMTVDPEGMLQVMTRHVLIAEITRQYARSFQQRLVAAEPPLASWPSDLEVPFTEFGDMVSAMTEEVQVTIGMLALALLRSKSLSAWARLPVAGADRRVHDKLKAEVAEGKTILMETGAGEVERVVSVIALRIEDWAGNVLAQIGKLEDGVQKPECQLPGGKYRQSELLKDAVKRIIRTKIPWLGDKICMRKTKQVVEQKESSAYGLRTTYLRTICTAALDEQGNRSTLWSTPPEEHRRLPSLTVKATSTIQSVVSSDLLETEVYMFRNDSTGSTSYYAFLDPETLEQLSCPQSKDILKEWLSLLEDSDEHLSHLELSRRCQQVAQPEAMTMERCI